MVLLLLFGSLISWLGKSLTTLFDVNVDHLVQFHIWLLLAKLYEVFLHEICSKVYLFSLFDAAKWFLNCILNLFFAFTFFFRCVFVDHVTGLKESRDQVLLSDSRRAMEDSHTQHKEEDVV